MTAGSAGSSLAGLYGAADLPCADFGLLAVLKRSPEYDSIRRRAIDRKPVDAWRSYDEHYFVFQLSPAEDSATTATATSFALFKMRWEDNGPAAALIITPTVDGTHAEVRNLSQPDKLQIVPLASRS